jgi:hypothetical protein
VNLKKVHNKKEGKGKGGRVKSGSVVRKNMQLKSLLLIPPEGRN